MSQGLTLFLSTIKGILLGEQGGLYYDIWAKYYVKFFQAYQEFGLEFWGVTAQNEPSDCLISKFPFNCLGFTPEMQADFVTLNLGPQLANNGFGNIKIMVLDDHRLFLPLFPQRLFQHSPSASKYVSGIAVHWYLDLVVPPSVLDETNAMFPDKFLFETESCLGQGPQEHVELGSFARGESYAKYIIQVNLLLVRN
jgi:glucosylceramidase